MSPNQPEIPTHILGIRLTIFTHNIHYATIIIISQWNNLEQTAARASSVGAWVRVRLTLKLAPYLEFHHDLTFGLLPF